MSNLRLDLPPRRSQSSVLTLPPTQTIYPQIPASSVSVLTLVPGSVVATLLISITDASQTAATMFSALQANAPAAFNSSFMAASYGVTGITVQRLSSSASSANPLPPFPPTPPLPPGGAIRAVVGGGGVSTSTSTDSNGVLPPSPPLSSGGDGTNSGGGTSTTVIILATVLSVVGAALIASVAVIVVVKRKNNNTARLVASPSDREGDREGAGWRRDMLQATSMY